MPSDLSIVEAELTSKDMSLLRRIALDRPETSRYVRVKSLPEHTLTSRQGRGRREQRRIPRYCRNRHPSPEPGSRLRHRLGRPLGLVDRAFFVHEKSIRQLPHHLRSVKELYVQKVVGLDLADPVWRWVHSIGRRWNRYAHDQWHHLSRILITLTVKTMSTPVA